MSVTNDLLYKNEFAKIRDETHCLKMCNYVYPTLVDDVSIEASCDIENHIVYECEEPSEQYSYNDFVEQTAKMAYMLKDDVVRGLSLIDLDFTDEILASMIGTSHHMIGTIHHMICEQTDSIHTYLNTNLLLCL